jgi:hypothetical protein
MSILSVTAGAANAVPTFLADIHNETTLAAKWAKGNGQAQSDIAWFRAHAAKLTSVDALMKDYRSLKFVLNAYNVSDLLSYPALTRQLLTQDPSASSSTAQKISNAGYLAFARAFNQFKSTPFATSANIETVVSSYVTNQFEAAQNTQTPGMQNALAFDRTASQITSITQLMTNKRALTVAVAQTGIDFSTYANMSYEKQVALLTKKIKLSDFQDATKVKRMAEQYLVQAVQSPSTWGATDSSAASVATLFGGTSDSSVLTLFGTSSTADPVLSLFA